MPNTPGGSPSLDPSAAMPDPNAVAPTDPSGPVLPVTHVNLPGGIKVGGAAVDISPNIPSPPADPSLPPPLPVVPPIASASPSPIAPPPAPPPLPVDPTVVPDLPKTAEISTKTVGDFLNWLFEKKMKGIDGINLDDLSAKIDQQIDAQGFREEFNRTQDKVIGPPSALDMNEIIAGYGLLFMLLDDIDQKDKDNNKVTLPKLDTAQEMIAELEAFNAEVAAVAASASASPTIPGIPVTVGPDQAPSVGPVEPDLPPPPDIPTPPPPLVLPKKRMSRGKIILIVSGAVAAVLAGGGIYSYMQDRDKKLASGDTEKTPATGEAVPTVQHSADRTSVAPGDMPSPMPVPVATAEPSVEPMAVPTIEPSTTPVEPEMATPEKITFVCSNNGGTPVKCRLEKPDMAQYVRGCVLKGNIPYKPLTLDCVDKEGYQGPVYSTPYDLDDRDMYTAPSTGDNVKYTVILQK